MSQVGHLQTSPACPAKSALSLRADIEAVSQLVGFGPRSVVPTIEDSTRVNPVTLPPGRAKLATKPLPIGSTTFAKMMGIERVSCSIDAVLTVFCVRIR